MTTTRDQVLAAARALFQPSDVAGVLAVIDRWGGKS
jgi:hypothetical protein